MSILIYLKPTAWKGKDIFCDIWHVFQSFRYQFFFFIATFIFSAILGVMETQLLKRKDLAEKVEHIHYFLQSVGGLELGWGPYSWGGAATLPAYKQTKPKALWCARRGNRRSSFSCLSLWPTATKEQPRHQAGRAASNGKQVGLRFSNSGESSQKLLFLPCCDFFVCIKSW